jgi:hypothetical protein
MKMSEDDDFETDEEDLEEEQDEFDGNDSDE